MNRAQRKAAEKAYNAVLARARRLAAGQSRQTITRLDALLSTLGKSLGLGSSGELSERQAAAMMAKVSALLDKFEKQWALETRTATKAILEGIVSQHRVTAEQVAKVLELKKGGVALKLGQVPAKTDRLLKTMRAGKTISQITRSHATTVDRAIGSYIEKAVGKMPSDDALRGIQRLLRGELPINVGGSRKADLRAAASLPGKVERLIVTESFEGYRQAQAASLAAGPVSMVAHWDTEEDEVVCETCEAIGNRDVGHGPGWYPPEEWPENPHPLCRCWQGEIRIVGE